MGTNPKEFRRKKMALLIVELVSSTPIAILPTHRKKGAFKVPLQGSKSQ